VPSYHDAFGRGRRFILDLPKASVRHPNDLYHRVQNSSRSPVPTWYHRLESSRKRRGWETGICASRKATAQLATPVVRGTNGGHRQVGVLFIRWVPAVGRGWQRCWNRPTRLPRGSARRAHDWYCPKGCTDGSAASHRIAFRNCQLCPTDPSHHFRHHHPASMIARMATKNQIM
jgi:hypothetical protein